VNKINDSASHFHCTCSLQLDACQRLSYVYLCIGPCAPCTVTDSIPDLIMSSRLQRLPYCTLRRPCFSTCWSHWWWCEVFPSCC